MANIKAKRYEPGDVIPIKFDAAGYPYFEAPEFTQRRFEKDGVDRDTGLLRYTEVMEEED